MRWKTSCRCSGQVVLAKVMPRQVVLDNRGTYELLTLFEDTGSGRTDPRPGSSTPAYSPAPQQRQVDKQRNDRTTELARSYRDRLYQNPQSLAEVVSVSAVRAGWCAAGLPSRPGQADKQQFEQLGFKRGDLVTGVNGIALNDPANTMRLYQTMRTASEAVFDLEREGQACLSVSAWTVVRRSEGHDKRTTVQ